MRNTKKLVLLALMIAQAMVLSIMESMIPLNFIVPGVKPGFANIITLLAFYFFSFPEVLLLVFSRALLTSLFSGNLMMFLFSLSGGILSACVMGLILKKGKRFFSILGAGMAGAFFHNVGQIAVAWQMVGDTSVFFLLPLLAVSGIITGFITGYVAKYLLENLKDVIYFESK